MKKSAGFTLLEVLLATAIMAVGTTSVLVVMATAVGMASQRQVNLRREQVIDEAREHAARIVDAWRPSETPAASAAPAKPGGRTPPSAAGPSAAPAKLENQRSQRFEGFSYDVSFVPKDKLVPEKGFDVTITVRYGGGELSSTVTTSLAGTVIAEQEFTTSRTYEEERKGIADQNKKSER